MKKILILGGTGFVGRILTEKLIKDGFSPVLFNRGLRNPHLFPELQKITGDRLNENDISQISNFDWDVVVDFSCMYPLNLELILNLLKNKTQKYIFISTCSVYPMNDPDLWSQPVRETAPTLNCTIDEKFSNDINSTYGNKKAECERILLRNDWLNPVIFRPGLIYGRYDPTDRFYYWLYRAKKADAFLIPDGGIEEFTAAYCEDFAELIKLAVYFEPNSKIYNAVTHPPVKLIDFINYSCSILNTEPEYIFVDKEFIELNNLSPWIDFPLWVRDFNLRIDNSLALKDFPINFFGFYNTVKKCIEYYDELNWQIPKTNFTPQREDELIKKIKMQN